MSNHTSAPKYRPDIDGLRAVAVIPVCCFHAGLPIFSGGFVGVDVFFVISGYLMASIIAEGLSRGDFSYVEFYERRIRRILPALFLVLAFTTYIACIIVPPKLFRDFGFTMAATVLFASNWAFSRKSANYFDAPTELNPLLHTWSLSVEEQFYIIFPVALGLLWRFGKRVVWSIVVAGALASLILSIWGTINAPTATFYLLPTRAWELLIGAILILWPPSLVMRLSAKAAWLDGTGAVIGLALILWSMVTYNTEMAFPGAAALAPCLGAAMILQCGRRGHNLASRLLSLGPIKFVGKISYSLYLWHWPLIVFAEKYHPFGRLGLIARVLIILVAGVVAWLSWRWVEQPFRGRDAIFSRWGLYGSTITLLAAFGFAGLLAQGSNGWPARFPGIASVAIEPQFAAELADQEWKAFNYNRCFVVRTSEWGGDLCFLSRHSQSKTLLWGDSFAASYSYGFFANKSADFDVLLYTSPACPPLVGYDAASRPECTTFDKGVADIIKRFTISTVIIAANWDSYFRRRKIRFDDIAATVKYLHGFGVRVILIGQSPVFAFAYPDEYFYSAYGTQSAKRAYEAPLDVDPGVNAKIASLSGADVFFDPMAQLCRDAECVFKDGGNYLFADHGHFSQTGSKRMVDAFMERLKR